MGGVWVLQSKRFGGSMKSSQLRARYRRIMMFFAVATLEFIFWELIVARVGFRAYVRKSRAERYRKVAARFRRLAVRMGGVMIKVGQFLSTRVDVLPPEITKELSGLQDEVPAEKFEDMRQLAEAELGAPLSEKFESFDEAPLAAASLGQVHRARLCVKDAAGEFCNVVVKIQRPFIDQLIEVDLSALRRFGGWLQHYKPVSKRVNVPALVNEFSTITRAEVDYLAEGHNAETFAENFKDVKRVHVPRVVWTHTTKKVLVLEDVFAIKITDYDVIAAAGINRTEVANALLDTYLKQIFEDGFFHADPHPGNLFITPVPGSDDQTDWRLTFVDFGMVGQVPENLRLGLREMLVSIGTKDAARLVRSYQTLDILLPSADLKLIEQAEAQLFDIFWGKSMNELRQIDHAQMFRFADQFRELMYEMPFQLPQNLLFLGRTVAILSGICTGLDSNFNLFGQLVPYATKLISAEAGSNSTWKILLEEIGNVLKELVALPAQTSRVLTQVERGDLTVKNPSANRQIASLEKSVDRLTGGIVFAALLIGGVMMYTAGQTLFAEILFGSSGVTLLWILFFHRGGPRRFHP
jgi:predicted unusual protein kinase regulating ubiquinone biosynthesis (AarF/ABC1/UbiB family)